MKKRFLILFLCALAPFPASAQAVRESFVSKPDISKSSEAPPPETEVSVTPASPRTNESYVNTNALIDSLWSETAELSPELIINEHLRKQQRAVTPPALPPLIKSQQNTPPPLSPSYNFQDINAIVLDAGHGGKDPGASDRRGINGLQEKWLVFSVMKKVHALFRKNRPDLKIYVTRKNDTFLTLEERVSKTARWSAPTDNNVLFISIHGNSSLSSRPEGLEIYTLSDKASDPEALEVERLENAGFSKEDIAKTQGLYSLLADLIRDGTRKQSEQFARFVYDGMLKQIRPAGGVGRGLRKANFFVLKYNTVPSILIEMGYISNPGEVRRLRDSDYHDKLAEGIFQGAEKFIDEYNQTKGFTSVKGTR